MIATATPQIEIAGYDPERDSAGFRYNTERANYPVEFMAECLRHTKGSFADRPLELEPWQRDIVRTLFGWVDDVGNRRYRRAYIEVARKNGKTTLVAAIALYVLLAEGEPGAECYCAASDADQATLLYSIATAMIRKNPDLAGAVKIRDSVKRIIYKDSFLRAIPADAKGSHGFNSHLNCNDELHTWHGEAGKEFYNVLRTGMASRTQPLQIDITTAGWDRYSICYKQHQYAQRVRDGVLTDARFLPVLYNVDPEDDWDDEKLWSKANPNLGVSVSLQTLRDEHQRAKDEPGYENTFRQLHLNQWTSQESRWIKMDDWRSCVQGDPIPPGAIISAGLDLSSTVDLTSLCICEKREMGYRLQWRFWLPEDRIEFLQHRDNVPYDEWIDAGYLETTPSKRIDYAYIKKALKETADTYVLGAVGYDNYNAAAFWQDIEADLGLRMVSIRQSHKDLNGPSKELEGCVVNGTLDHEENPIADWMAESVSIKPDHNGNIRPMRPDKNEFGKKIDGIVAAVMAIGAQPAIDSPQESIYATGGNLAL